MSGGQSRDIVVVGASAGGVEALQEFVRGLPSDLPATICVVLHVPRTGPRALAAILDRAGPLRVSQAEDGTALIPGHVYVAPPDNHLLMADGHVKLSRDPAINGHRPSIDALFRSAADAYGPRVIAVVLSGSGDDGAAGVLAAVQAGAVAIVKDPDQAAHASMPRRARDEAPAALVRRVEEIGPLVGQLVAAPPVVANHRGGRAAAGVDGALWLAVRALQDRSALNQRMARSRRACDDEDIATRYDELAEESDRAIEIIQGLLRSRPDAAI